MLNHFDTIFSPGLYLERDKKAFTLTRDRLLQQESCAVVCMYGNGKDYLFHNMVKEFEHKKLPYAVKILNTISADELKDFADMLQSETEPTLCMVNLRIGKDVSWFIQVLEELRFKRGHNFVSFVNAYVGDIYEALREMERPLMDSLIVKELISYEDAVHVIKELSDRFDVTPSETQKKDIYRWSYGHVGLLRSLFLLKQQYPNKMFDEKFLLHEPTILERLTHILSDIPEEKIQLLLQKKVGLVDMMFFEKFGYITDEGKLFHPLLERLIPTHGKKNESPFSETESKVLAYLRSHENDIISREDIGRLVWGEEEWEDKYSDWAIGQLIYRLRKKLEYSTSSGKIKTKKGKGFVYHTN
ncbi:MAG TPA: helix-turn-helix domain-containing protein [Candidatus Eisenbacteria bacterium]|nr:helix-turn-helix domain-containing protein [Candidatus Eisenbacteria bacterium]